MIRAVIAIGGGLAIFLFLALLLSVVSDGSLAVGFNPASNAPAIAARGKQAVDMATAGGIESDTRQRELTAAQAREQNAELWRDTRAARAAAVQRAESARGWAPWALLFAFIATVVVAGGSVFLWRTGALWQTVTAPVVQQAGSLTVVSSLLTDTTVVTDRLLPGYSLLVQGDKTRARGLGVEQQLAASQAAAQIGVAEKLAQARIGSEEQGASLERHRINADALVRLVEAANSGGAITTAVVHEVPAAAPQLEIDDD